MGRIFCEGYQAFWRGEWRKDCPYPLVVQHLSGWLSWAQYINPDFDSWMDGWLTANRDPYERFGR